MLRIDNISKSLGDTKVLQHCNLTIPKGSVLGLIGPNGAGKSTLLRCISDVYQCDEGHILLNNEIISENPLLKQNILLLSDDPYYSQNKSIYDIKQFYQVFYPSFDEEVYSHYLKVFGLDERKSMKTFSKGMKRQAFIIFALAISPQLLLLDEAFDGLDPLMRLVFKRAISEHLSKKDMTIIISSHNLRELEDICDYYALLDDHTITTQGDINNTKDYIHKLQVVFNEEKCIEDFKDFDCLHITFTKRVVTLIVKGSEEEIISKITQMNPLVYDILDISLEELFLYSVKRKENEYVKEI